MDKTADRPQPCDDFSLVQATVTIGRNVNCQSVKQLKAEMLIRGFSELDADRGIELWSAYLHRTSEKPERARLRT